VLENVDLANVHVTAGDGMVAGALVGSTTGLVIGDTSSGTVTVGDTASGPVQAAAGGLVGDLGDGAGAGEIALSSSSATVTGGAVTQTATGTSGNTDEAGGFVGFMGAGTIQFAFASGAVSTIGAAGFTSEAGGFVGRLGAGEIADAYAKGAVSGDFNSYLGGF